MIKILMCLFFLSFNAQAENRYYGGLGFLFYNVYETATTASGSTGLIGPIYYPLQIRAHFPVWNQFEFAPRILYTIPRSNDDDTVKTTLFLLSLPVSHVITQFGTADLEFIYGLGLLQYQIQGQGGFKSLNNGTGTTTFAVPGRDASVNSLVLELGAGIKHNRFKYDVEAFFSKITDDRMAWSVFFTVNYQFNGSGSF